MMRIAGWLVRRIGVPTLIQLALLAVALGSVALGLADTIQGLEGGLLLPLALLGLLLGWLLAKSPLTGWLGSLVAMVIGSEAIFLRVGRLGGPLLKLIGSLATELIRLVMFLMWGWWRSNLMLNILLPKYEASAEWATDNLPHIAPVMNAFEELWAGASILLVRLRDWTLVLLGTSHFQFDLVAIALLWGLAVWLAAVWAGWFVRRRHQILQAVTPAGVLLSGSLFYVRGNHNFLLPLLAVALLMGTLTSHNARQRRWEATGVDFPLDVEYEVILGGAALSFVLVMVAAFAPSISVKAFTKWTSELFTGEGNETRTERAALMLGLGADSQPVAYLDQKQVRAPGLPRRHLLGTGPELSQRVVMLVYPQAEDENATATPEPSETEGQQPPRYYWRSLTYDEYTGRGWATADTRLFEYQANELAYFRDPAEAYGGTRRESLVIPPGRQKMQIEVRPVGDSSNALHMPGELVSANKDYRVAWRASSDIFGASFVDEMDSRAAYHIVSLVPAVGEAQLRATGRDYPRYVQDRYLELSNRIPPRVLALARDLTATAPTPYDRARAIEDYLRTFPYTLNLPPPPPEHDVVDYFLFDVQQGYCDYYASAMVVLARAAGLPARLAMGYHTGVYDEANRRYVVTEADAHSWVEIYFVDYGWIVFEPTAGRPPIDRPQDVPLLVPEEPETAERATPSFASKSPLWWLGVPGGLLLLGLGGIITWSAVDVWRLRRLSASVAMTTLYQRLHRHGRRLKVLAWSGDTPFEFTASLVERVSDLWQSREKSDTLDFVAQKIHWLTDLYVRVLYSPRPIEPADQAQAIQIWQRLRWHLWLAWLWNLRQGRHD